ncbi:Lin1244/Lin1753 domain-containing protein [Porphyromonas endodontalis]
MGRPSKETVDYFPHYVKSGRTIFILESKFGNDGYAFWFKLLEILGESEGHYYDCSISNNWEYLLAKTRCDENTANEIIETLISLGKIDGELWNEKRIVWCKNFVDNLSFAYNKRHVKLPSAPSFLPENYSSDAVSVEKTIGAMEFTERKPDKEKKRKEKESNSRLLFEDKSSHNNPSLYSAREDFDEAQNCDDKQIENEQAKKRVARFVPPTIEEVQNYISEKNYEDYVSADHFINFHESKGWMIGKNKMKDWRAAVRTWVLRAKEQQKEKRQKQTLDVNSEWR